MAGSQLDDFIDGLELAEREQDLALLEKSFAEGASGSS